MSQKIIYCSLLDTLNKQHPDNDNFINSLREQININAEKLYICRLYDLCLQRGINNNEAFLIILELAKMQSTLLLSLKSRHKINDYIASNFKDKAKLFYPYISSLKDHMEGLIFSLKDFDKTPENNNVLTLDINDIDRKFCSSFFTKYPIAKSIRLLSQELKKNYHFKFTPCNPTFSSIITAEFTNDSGITKTDYIIYVQEYLLERFRNQSIIQTPEYVCMSLQKIKISKATEMPSLIYKINKL